MNPDPSRKDEGPVAVVTGAASGIGAAIAGTLATRGVRVAGFDRSPSAGCALSYEVDVADAGAVERAVQSVAEALGPPTLAVHSAGITRDRVLWKLPVEDWDLVLRVNLSGAFHLLRALAPFLRGPTEAPRGGSVVLIGSINGTRGKFGQTAYAASKAGLVGLCKSAARELGPSGARVNLVAPGMVETPMVRALPAEFRDRAREETVLGRLGAPTDIAEVVAFLLSDAARHVTGQVLHVDGGQSM